MTTSNFKRLIDDDVWNLENEIDASERKLKYLYISYPYNIHNNLFRFQSHHEISIKDTKD
jgi:hypothetical protein